MRSKLLTLILTISMVVSLTPLTAFATDDIGGSGSAQAAAGDSSSAQAATGGSGGEQVTAESELEGGTQPTAEQMLEDGEYREDTLLVSFDADASNKKIRSEVAEEDGTLVDIIRFGEDTAMAQVEIAEDATMEEAIEDYLSNPMVESVQPDYIYKPTEIDPFLDPSKAGHNYLYHFDSINVMDAWDIVEANKQQTTTVAVIDTGVDSEHEDLQVNVNKDNYRSVTGGKITECVTDSGMHGTHVTGIIGATYGNGIGTAGVAAGHNNDLCRINVARTSPDGESLYTSDIIAAIKYVCNNGAQVVNMSFGGPTRDFLTEKVIRTYYDQNVVFVAASGNEETDTYCSPGCYKEVISVNASNKEGESTYWSNYGYYHDVTAPGNNIMSTIPTSYAKDSGTSMASPVTAAVVALMLDVNPTLTPEQVRNILAATASGNGTFDEYLAYGIIDAAKAVEASRDASGTAVTSLSLKSSSLAMRRGDYDGLETLILPATSLATVSWSSSNPSVATVDSKGFVTAVGAGTAMITASSSGRSATCTVTVADKPGVTDLLVHSSDMLIPGIGDDGRLIDGASYSIAAGSEYYLDCATQPASGEEQEEFLFESSDESVVIAYEDGVLEAVAPGTADVSVSYYSNDYNNPLKATFHITVERAARIIDITGASNTMIVGDTETITATPKYEESDGTLADAKAVTRIEYSSSNKAVASITNDGTITAKKPGTTYITVKVVEGNTFADLYETYKLVVGKAAYEPEEFALKGKTTVNSVTLTWNAIGIADTYSLERSTSSNFSGAKTIEVTAPTHSYADKGLTTGKKYYYRVTALRAGATLGTSAVVTVTPALGKPTLKLKAAKKSITCSWSKVSEASGYKVYRATSKNGRYSVVKTLNAKTTSYKDAKLTSGKTYYYKVAAYTKSGGKTVYGYSSIKSAKAK